MPDLCADSQAEGLNHTSPAATPWVPGPSFWFFRLKAWLIIPAASGDRHATRMNRAFSARPVFARIEPRALPVGWYK